MVKNIKQIKHVTFFHAECKLLKLSNCLFVYMVVIKLSLEFTYLVVSFKDNKIG